jgi:hemolysin III
MSQHAEISRFSREEEVANSVSHFIGALLSTAALIMMIIQSSKYGTSLHVISTSIFGASMILLYMSSGMTHYLEQGKLKNLLFSADRIAIYILIAGTYTPLVLITLKGGLGWTIFGIEWACVLAGSVMILFKPVRFEKGVNTFTVITYVIMGWLILIAIVPIVNTLPTFGWLLIIIGGILYSIGVYFYKKCNFRYHHFVWHLFVIGGNAAHFFTIYFYVIPRS